VNGDGDYRDAPLRPYVLTGGRAAPSRNSLNVDTLLIAASGERPLPVTASRQERALLRTFRGLLSVAEAAALLGLPVSVVQVLASDLIDSGHLHVRSRPRPGGPSLDLLQEVLDGLLNLR
jgi:hypothetical protein